MTRRVRLRTVLLSALLLCVIVVTVVPAVRHSLLRSAGWVLVANDAIAPADVIVISIDSGAAGVLEAADLFRTGVAPRVVLFRNAPDPAQSELRRRGIAFPDSMTLSTQLLRELGVTAIEQIAEAVAGTDDEGEVLRRWCAAGGIGSIVFVSAADHSRRTRRVLARSLSAGGTRVVVRASRYSTFDPDSWWRTRGGQRTEITESEKLLLDIVGHPFD